MDNFYYENFRRQLSASTKAVERISKIMSPAIQSTKAFESTTSTLKINSENVRRAAGIINRSIPSSYLLNEIKNVNRRNDYLIKNNQLISQYVKNSTKNLNPLINSAAFESYTKTMQTMRAVSNKNSFIFRQWSKLQRVTISPETIGFLVNKENTKQLSESFNISEDIFTNIQDEFSNYDSFFSEDIIDQTRNSEDTNQIPSYNVPIKNRQNDNNTSNDYPKRLHSISPLFIVWLFTVFFQTYATVDGIINDNKVEAITGASIDTCLTIASKVKIYDK